MFGREKYLKKLVDSTELINKCKFGGISYIYAQPGYGKTVLVNEFAEKVNEKFKVCFLQTENLLDRDFACFVFFFNRYFNQSSLQLDEERLENFQNEYAVFLKKVKQLNDKDLYKEMVRIKSIIAGLIGISIKYSIFDSITPKGRELAIKIAVCGFFKTLSLIKPIIIITEDIQWIDNHSQDIFRLLTRSIENYPLMILATGRGSSGVFPKLNTDIDYIVSVIKLYGLTNPQTSDLIEEILGYPVTQSLFKLIKNRTEKCPFLIEQFCLYLKENNLIYLKNNKYKLQKSSSLSKVNIEDILFSRIDNLSENLYNSLLKLSLMGKSINPGIASEIVGLLSGLSSGKTIKMSNSDFHSAEQKRKTERHTELSEISYILGHYPRLSDQYKNRFKDKLHKMNEIAVKSLTGNNQEEYRINLAFHYQQMDSTKQAIDCYIKSADYSREHYNLEQAVSLYKKALQIMYNKKEDNQIKIGLLISIGDIWSDKAEFKKAYDYYQQALKLKKKISDKDNPETAELYMKMGKLEHQLADFDKALKSFKAALSIQKKLLGENHPQTAMIYNKIGRIYSDLSKYRSSIKYFNKALDIEIEILGEKHFQTAVSFNDLGNAYRMSGSYQKAMESFNKALGFKTDNPVRKKIQIAKFYNNIGTALWISDNYKQSIQYVLKSLKNFKEIYGLKHPLTGLSMANIGTIYTHFKQYTKSFEYNRQALKIFEDHFGKLHPHVAKVHITIGQTYSNIKNYKEAFSHFVQAEFILKSKFKNLKNSYLGLIYHEMGYIYHEKNDPKNAKLYYRKAIKIYQTLHEEKNIEKVKADLKKL